MIATPDLKPRRSEHGWMIRALVPKADFGALSIPRSRSLQYADGWMYVGEYGPNYIVILVDKEGTALAVPTLSDSQVWSLRLGQAFCHRVLEYNQQYQAGMPTR